MPRGEIIKEKEITVTEPEEIEDVGIGLKLKAQHKFFGSIEIDNVFQITNFSEETDVFSGVTVRIDEINSLIEALKEMKKWAEGRDNHA